jgi:hypothetical protein
MKIIIQTLQLFLLASIALSTSFGADDDFEALDITLINQNPDPVYAGDIFEITIGIENSGYGSLDDVILKVEEEYPFTIISNEEISLDTVFSSSDFISTQKIKLKVNSDTQAGDYELVINQIQGDLVIGHTVTLNVASNKNIEVVGISENTISPGAIEEVSFSIKNVGSTQLRNIEFSWEDEDQVLLPVNGDNKVFIDSLLVGEETEVTYLISASSAVSADLYKIDISLSYENSETSEVTLETSNAGIYVGGETIFDIILDEISGSEYVFTVANIGSNDASSVKISVDESSSWETGTKSAEIIGDLNKGDYTTISLEFEESRGDLVLRIDYTDTSGNRVFTNQELKITTNSNSTLGARETRTTADGEVASQRQGGNPISGIQSGVDAAQNGAKYFGFGVILFILLIVGFKYYKKKKN